MYYEEAIARRDQLRAREAEIRSRLTTDRLEEMDPLGNEFMDGLAADDLRSAGNGYNATAEPVQIILNLMLLVRSSYRLPC